MAISRALKGKKRGHRAGTKTKTVHRGRKTITRKKYSGKRPGNVLTRATYVVRTKKKNKDGSVTKTRSVRQRKVTGKQFLAIGAGAAIAGNLGASLVIRHQNKKATNFKTIKARKVTTSARRKKR